MDEKPKYYVVRKGYAYWQPTKKMRDEGAKSIPLGKDGPASREKAEEINFHRENPTDENIVAFPAQRSVGYVYFLRMGPSVKIGFSKKPWARIADLRTGFSRDFDSIVCVKGTMADERAIHRRFQAHRITGEWFSAVPTLIHMMYAAIRSGTLQTVDRVGTGSKS
jgi:hypothetical protein